jgi:outer membrane biogenesis lipoprotein LolB
MVKMKFVGLTVACLFLMACANSGTKTAANSAGSSGSERTVTQTTTAQNVDPLEEPDYEDSFADAE